MMVVFAVQNLQGFSSAKRVHLICRRREVKFVNRLQSGDQTARLGSGKAVGRWHNSKELLVIVKFLSYVLKYHDTMDTPQNYK